MKYVFFGTPRFAEIVLAQLLHAGMPPVAVVCNPDRPVGRKQIITPPPTKEIARAANIPVLQPENLNDEFIKTLRDFGADVFLVAAYGKILPKSILEIPRLGTVGIHPSLLPKYRGASPIQSVILNGEQETGVTLYLMDEKMDHGSVLISEKSDAIPAKLNYLALEEKLAMLGTNLFARIAKDFERGAIFPTAQDEAQATYTKKFQTDDGFVAESDLANAIAGKANMADTVFRKINALNPEPGAWTTQGGRRIKLLDATIENGALKLKLTQAEGEKPKAL